MAIESKVGEKNIEKSLSTWIPDEDLNGSLLREIKIKIDGRINTAYLGNGIKPNVYTSEGNILGFLNSDKTKIYLANNF